MRVCFFVLLIFIGLPVQAGVKLVTTIQPLTLLAQPLLAEGDQVIQLLPANQSPHYFALSVSQRRALADADLIVWVGPDLETALVPLLESSGAALEMAGIAGIEWPAEDGEDHGDHQHGQDPHLWMNPANAQVMISAIEEALVAARPEQAAYYRQEGQAFRQRLADTDAAIRVRLGKAVKYISFHDAYGHWNRHYGSQQLAAVGTTPEQKPSARHLYALQKLAPEAQCLLAESLYVNQNSENLARQLRLPLVMADPLGQAADSYEALLLNLAQMFETCHR